MLINVLTNIIWLINMLINECLFKGNDCTYLLVIQFVGHTPWSSSLIFIFIDIL